MPRAVEFVQPRFAYVNAAGPCELIRTVFGDAQIRSLVGSDLDDPVLESVRHILARDTEFVGLRIPSDDRLGLRAARRRSNPENLLECVRAGHSLYSAIQDMTRLLDDVFHAQRKKGIPARTSLRSILQRPHSP